MRYVALGLLIASLLLGCKKPEPSLDEKLAAGFAKNGVTISAANGRTTPLPPDALLVFVLRDTVAIDVLSSFVIVSSPMVVMTTDPTQAPRRAAPSRRKRSRRERTIRRVVARTRDAKRRALSASAAEASRRLWRTR